MKYVDGFVLVVAKKNLAAYRKVARQGAAVWKEYGALEYMECVGDDLDVKWGVPFPRLLKLKSNETAIFSWIVYKSRAQRDRINAKIMKDPRFAGMDPEAMPFDVKRMTSGEFKI